MSDLIDRQALLSKRGELAYCEVCPVWSLIKDAPSVAASPWRRVEEELPKEVGSYLTAYSDGFVCENQWHYIGPTAIGWVNDAEAVRYWMPLPEPPKEEENGN